MKYILKFAASVLVLFSAHTFSEPKDYQKVWMDEPLSLHDMMIIEADKKLDENLSKYTNHDFIVFQSSEISSYEGGWDWIKKPSLKYVPDFLTSLQLLYSAATYDWDNGKYLIYSELTWHFSPEITLYTRDINHDQGLLANTQKNIVNACDIFLKKLHTTSFWPPSHKGYTNKKIEELYPAVYGLVFEDTIFKAKIFLNTRDEKTFLICSRPFGKNTDVKYEFTGDWHKLHEYQKSVREMYIKNGLYKEIK
jgi:hypothetical protein